jgi:cephalosporin hydroxylase
MNEHEWFKSECAEEICKQGADAELETLTRKWIAKAAQYKYSYHFEWLGRPVIQHPQDLIGLQELIWKIQPTLIIETGVARGGSLIFYASMLELIACCGGQKEAVVLGVDIDIREHNRNEIMSHPLSGRIGLIQGSSIPAETHKSVLEYANKFKKVLVCLDSNHTHEHVLGELRLYAPLVSKGSYCVVFDTIIEDLPEVSGPAKPWCKSNNPKTAVVEYLKMIQTGEVLAADGEILRLEIDKAIENQLLITVAPDGFLSRT